MSTRFVVTLPARAAWDPVAFARRAAEEGADVLEVRGDLTPDLAPFASPLPLLLSPRGGDLTRLAARGAAWLDVEPGEEPPSAPNAWRIASHHDHERTPPLDELLSAAENLRASGCDLVKLATRARGYDDLLTLERARVQLARGGPVVVHAMGPLADLERARSPWRNPLTYACLDTEQAAAAGQWTLARYRRLAGESEPAVFGVFGGPAFVRASASPDLHERLFREAGTRAVYLRFPSEDGPRDLAHLRELGVAGLSVTAPWKQAAFAFAGARDDDAVRCGAANTLLFAPESRALQLDVTGIVLGYPELADARGVAVVGSGGVVPAVLLAGERLGWRDVELYARDAARAGELAQRFGVRARALDELGSASAELVLWCLPVDLDDLELPPPHGAARLVDLRYGAETSLARRARDAGWDVRDGRAMLERQAEAQSRAFVTARSSSPRRSSG